MLSKMDLSRIKLRLGNIGKKATKSVSFVPSDIPVEMQEYYTSSRLICLETFGSSYALDPQDNHFWEKWNIFAYDESTQNYRALEGDLLFCSSSTIKMEDNKYAFDLTVLPYFLTSMRKFKGAHDEEIFFAENFKKQRNMILINSKRDSLLKCTEPHSIVLIDGPLVGGNAAYYMRKMDDALRKRDCIPLYFVKNSNSRLVIENTPKLSHQFNSDFHWAVHRLKDGSRSPFFKYTDQRNSKNSKVFAYMKAHNGFPQRIEMHYSSYEKYSYLLPSLMNLIAYFHFVQGDYFNPQVRPIVIAEKYAREGLRILNIPVLLGRLGFHPTINQMRFG